MAPRRERTVLLLALALGLAVRLARVARAPLIHPDGPAYLDLALAWRGGQWGRVLGGYYSPLYPVAVAPLLVLGVPAELAGRLVATAAGLAILPLLHRLTRRVLGAPEAAAVLLLAAVQPALVKASAQVLPETLAGVLLLGWLLLVDARGANGFVAAGALAGAAYLARPEAVLLVPLGLLRGSCRRRPAVLAVHAAAALLTMAPVLVALHSRTGHWQLSQREGALLPKAGLAAESSLVGAAIHHPATVLEWMLAGTARQLWNDAVALSPLLWVPFAAGLVARRAPPWPLGVVLAFTALPLALDPSPRYAVPLVPLLLLPTAGGVLRLTRGGGRRAAAAALALVVALVLQGLWKSHPLDEACAREVRDLLLTRYGPGQALVAVDGRFAYAARGRAIVPRSTRPEEALALARQHGASLWLTRPRWLGRAFIKPPRVHEAARPCGGGFVLFELEAAGGGAGIRPGGPDVWGSSGFRTAVH